MNAVSIGPLVMAADRFAVVLGVFVFILVAGILAGRIDGRFQAWSWWAIIGGIFAARLGHVAVHWRSFGEEPWRIFAFWQGGFFWPAGAAAIALTVLVVLKGPRQRLWSLLPLVLAVFVWNVTWQLTSGAPAIPMPGKAFATFGGEPQRLGGQTGRPVVINLWATWCPPCRREMPMMANIAAASTEVDFVFANQGEGHEAIARYLVSENVALKTILLDQFGELSRHYRAPGLPATLFIGADGILKHAHIGEISREVLQSRIARLRGTNHGEMLELH